MDDLFGDLAPAASSSGTSSNAAVKPSKPVAEEEEYESVLFVARECFVYRLPARTSTAGYKAGEWGDMEAFIWKGRCRVMELTKGNASRVLIRLEDNNSGELFAQCPYDKTGKAVEAVLDSSRYFVMKAVDVNTGKHAYLGMGFQDRSEAFDFQVALQDWQKRQRAPKVDEADNASASPGSSGNFGPKRDFSLKEGQTISVKLGGSAGAPPRKAAANKPQSGGPIPLLAPPPSSSRR